MDGTAITLAITVCLVGSSAAGYVFGYLTSNSKKTEKLQCQLNDILENPVVYYVARDKHISNNYDRGAFTRGG